MGVPGWLLRIVIGFLTEREMVLRYKGGCSGKKPLPGGGPQGTRLGLFLFLILINAAGYKYKDLEHNIGEKITEKLSKRKPIDRIHLKYVDDMTMAQSMNLPDCLIPNPDPTPPRRFEHHDQTEHLLPTQNYGLQDELDNLLEYSRTYQMMISEITPIKSARGVIQGLWLLRR